MSWFVTPRVRYLHVPKTGGTWATNAMCAAGVPAARPEPSPAHATLEQSCEYDDHFTFAFVRHPLDYWRSYWAYRMRTGWDQDSLLDLTVASDSFETFIEGVIAHAPGAASTLFEQFVGPPEDEIAFIGRYEHLVDDVCLALRIAGERFDEPLLRTYPTVNASDYPARGSRYPPSLARRLAEAERRGIERFYAWEPIPARLLATPVAGASALPHGDRIADLTMQLRNARAELGETRRALQTNECRRHRLQQELELAQAGYLRRLRWLRGRSRGVRLRREKAAGPTELATASEP